ncbi:MAG: hypothetical protein RMJ66_02200 [Bacteroidia bacterium]|nr:hypothetical protein [Bacteroidia bacterium]MDW8133857.1 hypothetical protein [Bacteroidia bacterium]
MTEGSWISLLIVALSGILSVVAVLIFFWKRELLERRRVLHQQILQTTLPLRLQALERAALFLERNDPNNLFPRLAPHTFKHTANLIQLVFQTVQEEYLHNSAYQIYMGPRVWIALRTAKNTLLQTLNATLAEYPPLHTPPIQWVEKFKEKWRTLSPDPFQVAQAYLHSTMQELTQVN